MNAIAYNQEGSLLASGSDDLCIKLWKPEQAASPAACAEEFSYNSGHGSNVFQAKFLPHANSSTIVSAARDGQVRIGYLDASGGVETSQVRKKRREKNRFACLLAFFFRV